MREDVGSSHWQRLEVRVFVVVTGVRLDVLLDSFGAFRLEESAGIFFLVHLQQHLVGVFEMIVALVALIIHANAGTIAVVVFRAVCLYIGHVIAALSALPAHLPLFLAIDDLLNIVCPHFLLAEGCHAIPPTLTMLAVPTIYYQPVFFSLWVGKYVQHMSLAHIFFRPVVVEVVSLAYNDNHTSVLLVSHFECHVQLVTLDADIPFVSLQHVLPLRQHFLVVVVTGV